MRAGVRLIAQVPTLIAAHHAIRRGREPTAPRPTLSHAENLLYMLWGEEPSPTAVRFINKDLIVHADHSSNASAFASSFSNSPPVTIPTRACSPRSKGPLPSTSG